MKEILTRIEQIRLWGGAILLIVVTILTLNLVETINEQRQYKNDLAEINNIKYELFNANVWVDTIFGIVSKKIDEFEITTENKKEVRQAIAKIIDETIVAVNEMVENQNKCNEQDSLWECTKKTAKGLVVSFVDINDIRNHIPEFTDIAFKYLNNPNAKDEIKQLIKEKLYEISSKTFSPVDMSRYTEIVKRYNCSEKQACQRSMANSVDIQENHIISYSVWIFILTICIFSIMLVKNPRLTQYQVWILVLSCLVLLLGGVTTPMIEIEAKISELSFKLFGEPVIFTNQVMYYQCKSITDVVSILIAAGQFKMVVVGILVFVFSITFPVLKLLASLVYFYDINGKRSNVFVKFFALKSGKWSMADVLVVAIMMACIGFDGIIESQLSQLGQVSHHVDILTTGGSQLLAGFYLFLGFCIASLVFSSALENSEHTELT